MRDTAAALLITRNASDDGFAAEVDQPQNREFKGTRSTTFMPGATGS
jgi:hypothetical protein